MERDTIAKTLKPYRMRIDQIDQQIIDLLRQRYDVIEEVGHLKTHKNIPAVLQDRVDEVRERAAGMAAEKGLDEDFIRNIYAQIIDHSCALEETIRDALEKKAS